MRHASRRAEPDHRAAEADGVGEHAPVVAALPSARAVSGMLSKTADTNPSPSVVCHVGRGRCSTGISDADEHEGEQEHRALDRLRQHRPIGRRIGAVTSSTTQTRPRRGTGNASGDRREPRVDDDVRGDAASQHRTRRCRARAQSTRDAATRRAAIGAWRCCCRRPRNAEHHQRDDGGDVGVEHIERRDSRQSTSSWWSCRRRRCPSRRRSTPRRWRPR